MKLVPLCYSSRAIELEKEETKKRKKEKKGKKKRRKQRGNIEECKMILCISFKYMILQGASVCSDIFVFSRLLKIHFLNC